MNPRTSSLLLPRDIDQSEGEQALVYARMSDKPFLVKRFETAMGAETLVFFGNLVVPFRFATVLILHMATHHVRRHHIEQLAVKLIDYWEQQGVINEIYGKDESIWLSDMERLRRSLQVMATYYQAERIVDAVKEWIMPRLPKEEEKLPGPSGLRYFDYAAKKTKILKLFLEASEAHK